ncbi:MAG: hypothetical protein ACTSP9_19430, partial [Promethearchaeota archaeon]
YHKPENPLNVSNVVLYANVTSSSPFDVKKVVLYCDNNIYIIKEFIMYRYGDNPIQNRHPEDPLSNETNGPIYGYGLGEFETGEIITYWIVAYDAANNNVKSEKKSFTVT